MAGRLSPITQVTPQLIATATLRLDTPGAGFTDITGHAASFIAEVAAGEGTLLIFLRHTSASLTIQENADPDVQTDLMSALDRALDSRCGGTRRHAGACEGHAHRGVAARARLGCETCPWHLAGRLSH
jgi:secondary thiamine-phosphate synthase enzyme